MSYEARSAECARHQKPSKGKKKLNNLPEKVQKSQKIQIETYKNLKTL
jgi:hypothetical protein